MIRLRSTDVAPSGCELPRAHRSSGSCRSSVAPAAKKPDAHTLEAVPSRGTVHLGAILLRFDWDQYSRVRGLDFFGCGVALRGERTSHTSGSRRCDADREAPGEVLAPEDRWFQAVSKGLGQSHGWSPKGDSSTFVAHDVGASLTPIGKRAAASPFSHMVANQHLDGLTPPLCVSETRVPVCRRSRPS